MNLQSPMKRRLVLRAVLLGAAALASPRSFAFAVRAVVVARRGLAERASQCLASDPLVAALGAGYLGATGKEASIAHLLGRIGERWPAGAPDLAHLSNRSLRLALASIALRDFERADVIVVDGWVLARSEARLYALAHLVRRV